MRGLLWSFIIVGSVLISWSLLPQKSKSKSESTVSYRGFLSAENKSFTKVFKPRAFIFPQDHGSHPAYRIEWWYFTGNLHTNKNRQFGYELTFFRFALSPEQKNSHSTWWNNQMYMAHFALTDVENKQFYFAERFSRAGNELAGAATDKYHVWLYDWNAETLDDNNLSIHLDAKSKDFSISLQLTSRKDIALQGIDGFSRKSQ